MKAVRACSIALLVVAGCAAQVAAAQPPAAQEEFVPIDQLAPVEEIPARPLVAAAYAVAWGAVLVYVWSIWRRLGRVDRELAEVSRRLSAPGGRR